MAIEYTVFTKPWKMPLHPLGAFVRGLGFEGIELPVRPGYPVEPANVRTGLPEAVKILGEYGLRIASIAGPTDEPTIAACAEAGVPLIRIMASIGSEGYVATEARLQREYEAITPLLLQHGVKVGVQNHCGRFVANACGLRALLDPCDPRAFGVVWDAAHNALNGEEPELALDIVWPRLLMVNLKNAVWQRQEGAEGSSEGWKVHWTLGKQGLASWRRVTEALKQRHYSGVICLTAEYSEEHEVDRWIAEDIAFARSLFAPRRQEEGPTTVG